MKVIPKNSVSIYNYFIVIFLLLFWIIPLASNGLYKIRPCWVSKNLNSFYQVAGLFVRRQSEWPIFLVQAKIDENWKTIPDDLLFPMKAFGYKSRMQRLIAETSEKSKPIFYKEISYWILLRLRELHYPPISSIRFVRCGIKVDPSKTSFGHWENFLPENYSYDAFDVLFEQEVKP